MNLHQKTGHIPTRAFADIVTNLGAHKTQSLSGFLATLETTISDIESRSRPRPKSLQALEYAKRYRDAIATEIERRNAAANPTGDTAGQDKADPQQDEGYQDFLKALKAYRPDIVKDSDKPLAIREAILDMAIDLFDFAGAIGIPEEKLLQELEI